jgi:hypothetical protein
VVFCWSSETSGFILWSCGGCRVIWLHSRVVLLCLYCVITLCILFLETFFYLLVEVSRLPFTGFLSPHFLFSIKMCSSPACSREKKTSFSPNWTAYEAPCCHCFATCFLWNCYPAGQPVTEHPQCFQIPTKLDPIRLSHCCLVTAALQTPW